jgi:hypothetical protein
MALCEKTHMQLPLVGLADGSAENQSPPKSNELPEGTADSIARKRKQREYSRKHYLANRAKLLERHRESRKIDPKKFVEKSKRYYVKHRERILSRERHARKIRRAAREARKLLEPKVDVIEKTCRTCNEVKPINDFYYRADRKKFTASCKVCRNKSMANASLKWKHKNKSRFDAYRRQFDKRRYRKRITDPVVGEDWKKKIRTKANEYRKRNRDKVARYQRQRRKADPIYRLRTNMSRRINSALRGKTKSAGTMQIVGCSLDHLKCHLESQFEPEMNWSNMGGGAGQWSVDHIVPCAAHNLSDPKEVEKCFHWTNLRPLWHRDNIIKSSNYNGRHWRYSDHAQPACSPQPEAALSVP